MNTCIILINVVFYYAMFEKSLSPWQYETLRDLVAIPSCTPGGEQEILQYIKERIGSEVVSLVDLEDSDEQTMALVAELGTPIEQAKCSVLVHEHVDTVFGTKMDPKENKNRKLKMKKRKPWQDPWPDRYELKIDGDHALGSGAYDMKAGVMIGMDFAKYAKLPKGMHVDLAFIVDEEHRSLGQQRLAEFILEQKRQYKVCIGNDVIPEQTPTPDRIQRIIKARRGSLKMVGTIELSDWAGQHVALGAPDANDYLDELVEKAFKHPGEHQKEVPSHTLFGPETYKRTMINSDFSGEASSLDWCEFKYAVSLVPPEKAEETHSHRKNLNREEQRQRRFVNKASQDFRWNEKSVGVEVELDEDLTNYLPFCTDEKHPLMKVVHDTAMEVAHPNTKPLFVGGTSNADANLFYSLFQQHYRDLGMEKPTVVLDIPYSGSGAHNMSEFAVISSVCNVRAIMWELLVKALPKHFGIK